MRNQIVTNYDETSGKYRAAFYSYELTPSEHCRPILRLSSKPVFESAKVAAFHLFNALDPEVRANTDLPDFQERSNNERDRTIQDGQRGL